MGNIINFRRLWRPRISLPACDFYNRMPDSTFCWSQMISVILLLLPSGLAGNMCFMAALHTAAGPIPLTHRGSVLQWTQSAENCGMSGELQSANWNTTSVFPIMCLESLLRTDSALCLPIFCPGSRDDVSRTLCRAPVKPKFSFAPCLLVCCPRRGTNGPCRELTAESWEEVAHMREEWVVKAVVTHQRT